MMSDESLLLMARDCLLITLKIAGPVLLAGVLVGLLISVVQSATSLQDQTISTVPKLVVMLIAVMLLLPWITQRLVEYAGELFQLAAGL
jgi:flagellar biosynthesis protein FliQ